MSDDSAVTIVMIEDDEGHARLIEKNIRRAGVHNRIVPFSAGGPAVDHLMYDLGCNIYITKPVNYENFAQAIRQLGLFFMVMQVSETP